MDLQTSPARLVSPQTRELSWWTLYWRCTLNVTHKGRCNPALHLLGVTWPSSDGVTDLCTMGRPVGHEFKPGYILHKTPWRQFFLVLFLLWIRIWFESRLKLPSEIAVWKFWKLRAPKIRSLRSMQSAAFSRQESLFFPVACLHEFSKTTKSRAHETLAEGDWGQLSLLQLPFLLLLLQIQT